MLIQKCTGYSILFIIFHWISLPGIAQSCAQIVPPQLSANTRAEFEAKLAIAKQHYLKDSTDANAIIWLGRRTAYLGHYEQAIDIFSKGIALHPGDARLYRHRGHRYITVRCLDKAIRDFKKAASLIKGKADEAEPDGLPNAKNIPTSTLQSNIWYHLGLAYYMKSDYKKAVKALYECLEVSKNPDMYVATTNWLYISLRRLGRNKTAAQLLETIDEKMELIENNDYHQVLLLYKTKSTFDDPVKYLTEEKKDLGLASFGYGYGLFHLLNKDKVNAKKIFQAIIAGNQWSAFGFLAAEIELKKL